MKSTNCSPLIKRQPKITAQNQLEFITIYKIYGLFVIIIVLFILVVTIIFQLTNQTSIAHIELVLYGMVPNKKIEINNMNKI